MKAWTRPQIPQLPGVSAAPLLFDTASEMLVEAKPHDVARLYVCGITPYDATHLGHAATYLAFDTLQRVWLDAGYQVDYAQNITDIDDPLLERAEQTGVSWRELADEQIELFRTDMASLRILPPSNYVAVTEMIEEIAEAVCTLLDRGIAYRLSTDDSDHDDIYFDNAAAEREAPWVLGEESNLSRPSMLELFAERGGDPDRPGKRDALDPLLWRAVRDGEPSWPSRVGQGRPGWHIECSVIALKYLGHGFTVQGGGSDLIFPHHELSAGHAAALSGHPLAQLYSHAGMVAYQGHKMSKSLGNLVLVSKLRADGVDPRVIRLALLAHHYRSDWEWRDSDLVDADGRLLLWSTTVVRDDIEPTSAEIDVVERVRQRLHDDLDTRGALAELDSWFAGVRMPVSTLVPRLVDALLGVQL